MPTIRWGGPPPYQQIAEDVRAAIARGQWKVGDQLPTADQLAARWKVGRVTALRAIGVLRDEGYVTTSTRGTFVAPGHPSAQQPHNSTPEV